jgi:hypothetical protein
MTERAERLRREVWRWLRLAREDLASAHERVGWALALLTHGLAPFVARECKARYGDPWVGRVARNERRIPTTPSSFWPCWPTSGGSRTLRFDTHEFESE